MADWLCPGTQYWLSDCISVPGRSRWLGVPHYWRVHCFRSVSRSVARARKRIVLSRAPLGPVVGPIFGGFIAQRARWRWVYWVLLCACGAVTTGNVFLNSETNRAVLLHQKCERLRKELDRTGLKSAYEAGREHTGASQTREILAKESHDHCECYSAL